MLAPPISPAPKPTSRPSATASDAPQRADARPRTSFRDEVTRTRESDAARATRSRPEDRGSDPREVEGRDARVEDDVRAEREEGGSVRERPEASSRTDDNEGTTTAEGSTTDDAESVEHETAASKSETAAQPIAAKSAASEPIAPAFFPGWLPLQDAALAPHAPTTTSTTDGATLAVDAGTAPAPATAPTSAPAVQAAAPALAAIPNPTASADVAAVAEVVRTASAPDAPVPQVADGRGAPVGSGAAIAEELPKTAAPAAARLTPAELPAFLGELEVRIDAPHKSAVVELEPLDLGRLSVELSIEPGNGVRAEVRAERQEGFAAIDARLAELRNALLERGFASVSVQLSLGFAEHRSRHFGAPGGAGAPANGGARTLRDAEVRALAPARDGAIDVWA